METIREVMNYSLCYDKLKRMFFVKDEFENQSSLFDGFGADELMFMEDEQFLDECLFLVP